MAKFMVCKCVNGEVDSVVFVTEEIDLAYQVCCSLNQAKTLNSNSFEVMNIGLTSCRMKFMCWVDVTSCADKLRYEYYKTLAQFKEFDTTPKLYYDEQVGQPLRFIVASESCSPDCVFEKVDLLLANFSYQTGGHEVTRGRLNDFCKILKWNHLSKDEWLKFDRVGTNVLDEKCEPIKKIVAKEHIYNYGLD